MADDKTFQAQRSNDLNPRTAEPRLSAETDDPLAELARLIGQSESFTQFTRNNARREPVAQAAPSLAPDNWQYPARPEQVTSAGSHDPYGSAQDFYASSTHGGEDLSAETDDQAHWAAEQQQYASEQYGSEPGDASDEHGAPEVYVHDEAPLEPHEDAMYDDPPRVQRRSGLTTALVLIGCAMLGTAGAYAYRSYFGHARAMQPPPVIAADSSTPIKIVPATTGDPQAGKAAQNRVADAGKEQLVTKQEEPVSLKEPAGQAAARTPPPTPGPATGTPVPAPLATGTPVPTPLATGAPVPTPQPAKGTPVPAPSGATGGPAPQPAGAPPASASNEPKKVRTVTIRPDGGDVAGRPQVALAPGAGTASRSPAGAGHAPLSLDAQSAEPAAAPPTRTRTATAPSAPQAAPEGSTSKFVVQLSSQKTESEAQASFRSLQAKFPNELGGRQPIIRRVDLGNKGVFYRTMVGPFASAHEASQFCANYKASGGQCMVPNN